MATELFLAADINAIAEDNRRFHYIKESDPIYMEVQRGKSTIADWEASRQSIKDRFPYVTEDQYLEVPDAPAMDESAPDPRIDAVTIPVDVPSDEEL